MVLKKRFFLMSPLFDFAAQVIRMLTKKVQGLPLGTRFKRAHLCNGTSCREIEAKRGRACFPATATPKMRFS